MHIYFHDGNCYHKAETRGKTGKTGLIGQIRTERTETAANRITGGVKECYFYVIRNAVHV